MKNFHFKNLFIYFSASIVISERNEVWEENKVPRILGSSDSSLLC